MINKKFVVGILVALVFLSSAQYLRPVMASSADDDHERYTSFIINVSGQGSVCWSGASSGCTQSLAILHIANVVGNTLTFTASGSHGYRFNYYDISGPSGQISTNPYTISTDGVGPYITAIFATT
ncbi:MAG TPA: hypothetical protein VK503_03150 [Candidatus Bathyarchaeia archaeon]|nr:hypothetical protein [Candidatus Bathyarchaeia archaeon]